MSDRDALRAAYDRQADSYGAARNARYDEFRDAALDWFAGEVRGVGSRILDLGSGPGHEAVLLRDRGLQPLAVDFSPRMVQRCRERGIEAHLADLYELDLPAGAFAGAWVSFSLLHVPKHDVEPIMARISRALCPGGTVAVLLFEGTGEGPRQEDVKRFGVARYFSYYQPDELKAVVERHFRVVRQARLDISPRPTLLVGGRREPVPVGPSDPPAHPAVALDR